MVKWIKVSKGSRQIRVVSSVEGLALKVGTGRLVEGLEAVGWIGRSSGLNSQKIAQGSKARKKVQISINSEL